MRRFVEVGCVLFLACAGQHEEARAPARTEETKPTSVPNLPPTVAALAKGAQLFKDLGPLHRAVSTHSTEAQAYFDQGLRLTYGFNHDEATRSFARAAELDPSCAACFWGVSLTLGPNYNVPMLPDRTQAAWDALRAAQALGPASSPVEQALIAALGKRYKGPEPLDPPAQAPFDAAYAGAMREVARQYPDDIDVQVLFAEALMDANPWKLWTLDGKPSPGTDEIVSVLEGALARTPDHPGANHYFIHAVEASQHPERALPAAERLPTLMPAAGHLVHMPAHIYQRVGRYEDAAANNRRAVQTDLAYLSQTTPPGYYPMYLGHNYGFLAYAASMEGRSAESLAAARGAAKAIPPPMLEMMPGMDFFTSEQLLVMVRFGMWDAILAEPRPPKGFAIMTALWMHAQGMAHASTGHLAAARADLSALNALAASLPPELRAGLNPASEVVAVGAKAVRARIAEKQGRSREAIRLWTEAVAIEDRLAYSEPADWFYPLRHYLGAVLLEAKRPAEAEQVYRQDLARNPKNGWGLYGLSEALAAQKKPEAAATRAAFEEAWSRADVRLKRTAL